MKAVRNAAVRASLQGAIRPREASWGGGGEAAEDQTSERRHVERYTYESLAVRHR